MTPDEIKRLRELCEALVPLAKRATPGPWNLIDARTLVHVETDPECASGAGKPICSVPKSQRDDAMLIATCDPEYVVAITTLAAKALDALEAAQADTARLDHLQEMAKGSHMVSIVGMSAVLPGESEGYAVDCYSSPSGKAERTIAATVRAGVDWHIAKRDEAMAREGGNG